MSTPTVIVSITSPSAGTVIGRTVTVTGSCGLDDHGDRRVAQFGLFSVNLDIGPTGGGFFQAQQNGTWSFTGPVPDSVPDGAQLTISVVASGSYTTDPDHAEPFNAEDGTDQITVQVRTRPPEVHITPFDNDEVTSTFPFPVSFTGTSTGALSGITQVRYAVEGGPSGLAQNTDPAGHWATWAVSFTLPSARDWPITVTATDSLGRTDDDQTTFHLHEQFERTDPDKAFGSTIYLRELSEFAQRSILVGTTGHGPDPAALTARFRQPIDRLPDPTLDAIAKEPVVQSRVAVEVLRRFLDTPAPVALDQLLRTLAYETVLRELSTSVEELRRARSAPQPERVALADRLGFDIDGPRPDRLDTMTISPDEITDTQLENIFGFRSLVRTDPFQPIPAVSALLSWQQGSLRKRWQDEDAADRDGAAGSLPVIDPDHVLPASLAGVAGDPVHVLWTQRKDAVQTLGTQIDTALRQGGGSVSTFDQQITAQIGTLDLVALSARDANGEDVTADIAPLRLTVPGLRFLAGIRVLLAAGGTLIGAEWAEVRDVLVGVRKRRLFPVWRTEEVSADIVLQPERFLVDPVQTAGGIPPIPPSVWRVDPSAHADWLHTLTVRGVQAERLPLAQVSVLRSAEVQVLPAARDELLALIGSRRNPVETGQDTAARLSRELCIDLLADSDLLISRADQAAETLVTALFAVRSGRLVVSTDGNQWSVPDEASFDDLWEWFGSFQTWVAALNSFAYPENHLLPGLYREDLPAGLHPTSAYENFLHDLRAERMTPARARRVAETNRNAVLGLITADDLRKEVTDRAPVTDVHTNAILERIRDNIAPFYGVSPDQDQQVRELYWLAPMALAQSLQDVGEFSAALDWYQYAYAIQLPITRRRIFPGLNRERGIQTTFDRPVDWPVHGGNPHEVARHRADAYTRFTVLSIVRCLAAFAETQFVHNTTESNARARSLYETALDLIESADAAPQLGPTVPFPANPVWSGLSAQAAVGLDKIHRGLNITGARVGSTDEDSTLPSQYRSGVLIERAKNLVGTAQQLESAFLTAIEQRDNDAYTDLQAGRDLAVARAMVGEEDLKVAAAGTQVELAREALQKAQFASGHYAGLVSGGLNQSERNQLFDLSVARDLAAAGGLLSGIGTGNVFGAVGGALSGLSQAASLQASSDGLEANYERRAQEWQFQESLAARDVQSGNTGVELATKQQEIAGVDREVAGIQLSHAEATANFLATKFTNTELFEWMSGVLNQVYRYFLQQATAMAVLAQAQLAFERQEPNRGLIQNDYWQGPPDQLTGAADTTDRRGLTGSARLLQDITRLDQYAFETERRKLHLVQTVALSELVGSELQQFRETGVLTFATPQELFDREFPGHYLRLIKRVSVSVIALVPPVRGIRATLSASGVSRAVVARGPFATATLRRDPESIAFTSPLKATGLFDAEPDAGLLLPFEGMGVDAVWRLELPRAANPFDFRTIADVLLTIEYTTLDSAEHRRGVISGLDRTVSGDRTFSLRDQFVDTWFDLSNPDTVDAAQRMRAHVPLTPEDFPAQLSDLSLRQLTAFVLREDGFTSEITISAVRRTATGGQAAVVTDAGPVTTIDGVVGTRRPGGAPWQAFTGGSPIGDWELRFPDTPAVRSWFTDGLLTDIVLVMTVSGDAPAWS
jgi:hypothetical protein